jgi:hypothetical protein
MSATYEMFTDAQGVVWKIITLPDKTGGETVLVVEVKEDEKRN